MPESAHDDAARSPGLVDLPFFKEMSETALTPLAEAAYYRDFEPNEFVVHQNDRASAFFFIVSGRLQFLMRVEGVDDLLVGVSREPGALIGWAAFRAPYRYTASVRSEQGCRLLCVPRSAFEDLAVKDPPTATEILRRVASTVARRLEEAKERLLAVKRDDDLNDAESRTRVPEDVPPVQHERLDDDQSITAFLQESLFFEGFDSVHLQKLTGFAASRSYESGQTLFSEGDAAGEFLLLVRGTIDLSYGRAPRWPIGIRTITEAGDPFGWSALVEPCFYRATAVAVSPTEVLAINAARIERYSEESPVFGVMLRRGILQLIGNRLRATRIRLVARRYEKETLAVKAMIDGSAASLHVTSPLFKIPYLLEHRLTLSDAFHSLELLQAHGDPLERDLAGLALDILEDVHRELDLYRSLQRIYELVANAPADTPAEQVRRECLEEFAKLFERTRYVIQGEENLPEESGNIVIMNHLENDMGNLLPNDFRLTLDSHFVSAMILLKKYSTPPIRVIRKPMPGWFGFEQYFDRLGYIYVYSGHVDDEDRASHVTREDRRRLFLAAAEKHLKVGRSVVICPEGACYRTEDSPHLFRPGAFRLAAYVRPEPWIVPIAVANFDRKITRTTTAAVVHPPFRLSEFVADPVDDKLLFRFLESYTSQYREYVREARKLTEAETPHS